MSEYEPFMKRNKKPYDGPKTKDLKAEDLKLHKSITDFSYLNDPSSIENSSNPHIKEDLKKINQSIDEVDCSHIIRYLEEQNHKRKPYDFFIFLFTFIACLGTIIGIKEDLSLIVNDIISFFAN